MLRRTFALLILTSLAACKESAKTPRVAPVAPHAKSVAKAEIPRPVQLPTLCDKLASTELPSIKIEAMKIGAAITLWREALIKVDPSFAQLGFFLPEDDAAISLELPAGKAEISLAALLKAYACDSRKGERHVNVQKEGSAFAEDGAWIAAMYEVPAGFLDLVTQWEKSKKKRDEKESANHEIVCPGVGKSGSAPGSQISFIQSSNQLVTVFQEKDHAEIEKIIADLTPKPLNIRIESVCLRSPRKLRAEGGLDLSQLLVDPTVEVLSHQQIDGQSGQTLLLNVSRVPRARLSEKTIAPLNDEATKSSSPSQFYWAESLEASEAGQCHDELIVTPTLYPDGKTISVAISQKLSWSKADATRSELKMSTQNYLNSSSGDTRILLQETEPDGKHWRIHLVRSSVIKCCLPSYASLTKRQPPVTDLKVQNADAALLQKLSHTAYSGGAGILEKALMVWAAKEGLQLKKIGEASPEAHFRSCGPLTASDLLRELSFRSNMQAMAKDGVVELRWPQKMKKYKLDSSVYLVLKQEGFLQECKVVSEYFDGQTWVIEVEQAGVYDFNQLVEKYQSLLPLSENIHFDAFDLESRELQRLSSDHPDEAELLQRLKASKTVQKIRQVEGLILFGGTSIFATSSSQQMPENWQAPVPLDAASGTFLAPQASFGECTPIGCSVECIAQMEPVWPVVDFSVKVSDTVVIGHQKVQVQAQLGNKPVQNFPVEVPILRHQSIETKVFCRVGEVKLFARSTLPSDQAGQAATRERLFFVRIDATPQKPVIEELP